MTDLEIENIWERAVDTLASMCIGYKMGKGPTKESFISTLKIYADNLEKVTKNEHP